MLSPQVIGQVRKLAGEVATREGVELYDVEFVGRGGGRILRVYVSKKDSSASIDDCANVSRGLSLLLDVEDLIPGEKYELEVSTPGLERHLRETWHFESALGQKVRVKTNAPVPGTEGRKSPLKQVKGVLESINEEQINITQEDHKWGIPFGIIHRANVIYEFETPKKPNGKKSKR